MTAADAVSAHEAHIAALTTIHHARREPIDWHRILNCPAPVKPVRGTAHERAARKKLYAWSPSWLDRLRNLEEKKRHKLKNQLRDAIEQDDTRHTAAIDRWERETAAWKRDARLARSILDGDQDAWAEAINTHSEFLVPGEQPSSDPSQAAVAGRSEWRIDNKSVSVDVHTCGRELVPTEACRQLQSGKLSTRNMPKGRYWEIYLNYVSGCAFRSATDIFAILPLDMVVVTILEERLNPATGHVESAPILSVQVARKTLETINLSNAQAGAALTQFNHAMDFRKTQGFRTIEPLAP